MRIQMVNNCCWRIYSEQVPATVCLWHFSIVLEVLFQFDDMSLEEAAEHMVEIGKGGIQNVILPA